MAPVDNKKATGFLAKVFGRFSRSARSSKDDAAIPIVDENKGGSVKIDDAVKYYDTVTFDEIKSDLMRCLAREEIQSLTGTICR